MHNRYSFQDDLSAIYVLILWIDKFDKFLKVFKILCNYNISLIQENKINLAKIRRIVKWVKKLLS